MFIRAIKNQAKLWHALSMNPYLQLPVFFVLFFFHFLPEESHHRIMGSIIIVKYSTLWIGVILKQQLKNNNMDEACLTVS